MKLVKAAAVAGLAAAASLALGAPAMAAGKPVFTKATLHALHNNVKLHAPIVLTGKVTGKFDKKVVLAATLLEKGKDGKFHWVMWKGAPLTDYVSKNGTYTFGLPAYTVGKEVFEVDVHQAFLPKNHIVSNTATVTVKK